jgi:hypothetical protein
MSYPRLLASAALALSLATISYPTSQTWSGGGDLALSLDASSGSPFADPDGDMVPNCIEDVMRTSPTDADSDYDGMDDFEEIITFTSHDVSLSAKPVDHAMRVVVTSNASLSGQPVVYLHLLLRLVNNTLSDVGFHDLYVDIQGRRYSLQSLADNIAHFKSRQSSRDGLSMLFSIRLSSESDIQKVLPCTFGVVGVINNKRYSTGSFLMRSGFSEVGTLMPFEGGTLALQPVRSALLIQEENPFYRGGGRVCEMKLNKVGSTAVGVICEVTAAKCRAAPGLRCSMACPKKQGSILTIPGGLGTITGN